MNAPVKGDSPIRVTISGDIGSGKTVVGRMLAQRLGIPFYSIGQCQRELAAKRGMSTLQLNEYAETHEEVDNELDAMTVKLAASGEPFVIDSRIAWHFVPRALNVFLDVDPLVGGRRVLDAGRNGERYVDLESALFAVRTRREREAKRFRRKYDIRIDDASNYDLIVDTTCVPAIAVADIVFKQVRKV